MFKALLKYAEVKDDTDVSLRGLYTGAAGMAGMMGAHALTSAPGIWTPEGDPSDRFSLDRHGSVANQEKAMREEIKSGRGIKANFKEIQLHAKNMPGEQIRDISAEDVKRIAKGRLVGLKRHGLAMGGGAAAGGYLGSHLGDWVYGKKDPTQARWKRQTLNMIGGIGGAILGAYSGHRLSRGVIGVKRPFGKKVSLETLSKRYE